MSDEDGIRRTIAKYCQLFDSKKWDELAEIFAEDSSVTSRRGTFQGRANVTRRVPYPISWKWNTPG
jgi:hypothetical protein